MSKIFFFDLDGTLLTKEKKISPKTMEALKAFTDAGNHFCINTGRAIDSARSVYDGLGLDFKGSFLCGSNGTQIYSVDEEKYVYKTGVEIPQEYLRQMNRLAGMLELADDEFSRIRMAITDYRRRVQQLVQDGQLDDVQLDGDTFGSYLKAKPFDALNRRIASLNQAEIQDVPLTGYLRVFKALGCKTLGDVDRLRKKYTDEAYYLARHQLGSTDLDIISSAVGVQNILAQGGGKIGLTRLFNAINGDSPQNEQLADMTFNLAKNLPFMSK